MGHSVRSHLNVDIDAYDQMIRRFIPGYEAMIERATDLVAAAGPGTVLDLGAGTGALSLALLDKPGAQTVELWDVDPEMLAAAERRLGDRADRTRFVLRSYDEAFPTCVGLMASLSLHHIPELERKAALYRRAYAALAPGGVFVNADITMPSEPEPRAAAYAAWADHLVRNGIEEARAYAHFEEWSSEDTYYSREAELGALSAAGFHTECAWSEGPSTVLVGRKV